MKEFKILWEWPKCGIKTASEQLLLGKRHWLKAVTNLWFVVKKEKKNAIKWSTGKGSAVEWGLPVTQPSSFLLYEAENMLSVKVVWEVRALIPSVRPLPAALMLAVSLIRGWFLSPRGHSQRLPGASLPELLLHLPQRSSFHLFPLFHYSSYFYIINWSQVFTKIKKK